MKRRSSNNFKRSRREWSDGLQKFRERFERYATLDVMKDWTIRNSLTQNNVQFNQPSQFAVVEQKFAFPLFGGTCGTYGKRPNQEPIRLSQLTG